MGLKLNIPNTNVNTLPIVFSVFVFLIIQIAEAKIHHHTFTNFPGPTLKAYRGDKLIVNVINNANYNITLHWHGVRQIGNPWSDGPEYVIQCPIRPGESYAYTINLTTEEGMIWYTNLHSFLVNTLFPYGILHSVLQIILLSEWWKKKNIMDIPENAKKTGGEPAISDAYTINGQPGYLNPCSKPGKSHPASSSFLFISPDL
ncbi:hypothetical protein EUTSA_v10002968mg [Eutrema salsugineum]|uniref:Plastocyanin-like domain-containing protein n=1 Tax=Eutrema salsugineum TaxID=72664 RepID=V4L0B3_EUTSA|nr:hypothetical protein EUTSA_v10002968mg [Eutrema salsugineum]